MSLPRTVGYTIPLGFDETFSALAPPPSVPQSLRRVEPFKNARGSSSPSIDIDIDRSRVRVLFEPPSARSRPSLARVRRDKKKRTPAPSRETHRSIASRQKKTHE
jgi:hypothetical protein